MLFSGIAATLAIVAPAAAQGLSEGLSASLEGYPSFSIFRSLLTADPGTFNTAVSKRSDDLTVFIPTDEAFKKYLAASGIQDISSIDSKALEDFFAYHVADKSFKGSDFEVKGGLVVPTLLEDEKYNNRSAGDQLKALYGDDADGQVLFAKPTSETGGAKRFRRQAAGGSVTLRAGLGQDVEMTVLDGTWGNKSGNSFQAINQVLQPPRECSTTIRAANSKLSSLDAALNKTGLYPALDTLKNVTCLGPISEAFKKAGNPEIKLGKEDLTNALLAHTLKEVTYTTFLKDGQILETMAEGTVTVHIKGDDIYFNNAKVVNANVLTNNGLIHMLDSLIESEDEPTKTGSSPSGTATPTTVPTNSPNAAGVLSTGYSGAIALLAILAVM